MSSSLPVGWSRPVRDAARESTAEVLPDSTMVDMLVPRLRAVGEEVAALTVGATTAPHVEGRAGAFEDPAVRSLMSRSCEGRRHPTVTVTRSAVEYGRRVVWVLEHLVAEGEGSK